ncbi:MAG: hypothetical protein JWM42_3709 [Burkholderia sp.]|jgi:Tfp pilus assembly protein PilE|nr:hypothetical protein [Burkholderia sp.]
MPRGPAYTYNELVILTLLALMATTIVVGVLGFVTYRIYKASTSRRRGKALARIEPA